MPDKEKLFEQIVRENREKLYRICRACMPDPDDANDLYQEVLVKVWLNLHTFRGGAKLSTWLYRVALNTAILHKKKQRNHTSLLPQHISELSDTTESGHKQEQEALLQQLHHCISCLEKQDRLIISLVLEEVSYKEIAEVMGLTVNHVGVKINRIKQRLAVLMEQTGKTEVSTVK
ncbi:RNA polymerase sigma factor [Pontibacter oryzae]|uniref:Sigma-70 family RNA polymerase sigma factor n=1 Tax=Pontibacter oryzae TaxID=2304593 RepID=A0A399S2D1_9BACT|nr:sigma-70 family RNA polymerase sigma factor [Pontibacter oryzae]RIJ36854.1 sigma-70 family RNA polymerase sigma factor [Pontibacter oryzae]